MADLRNTAAPNVPYFTPAQDPPAGTAYSPQSDGSLPPTLFTPLTLRGTTFQNRIFLAPLCQYSAKDGLMTPWHFTHLGAIFTRGPGCSIIEATSVVPEGRITPEDVGLWNDEQEKKHAEVVAFAHTQGQKIGIQIAHAGRKASTLAPWVHRGIVATKEQDGWPDEVYGPSDIPYNEEFPVPKAMTEEQIKATIDAFVATAKRAVNAGYDVIEIHNAHGYLLHSFLSPLSNKRTDKYGGSFENRTRLTLEVVEAVRAAIPKDMPLFFRISALDWVEDQPSWTLEETVKLAPLLAARGVDLIDVSSGGLHPSQKITGGPAYQAPFAKAVKAALKGTDCVVSSVGSIESGKLAQELLENESCDIISVGRGFQRNPGLVWAWADELEVEMVAAHQMVWGFGGKAGGKKHA
ncbi:FMN-linked oxidoreductase [Pyronema omphalodes]|nr:FMN-linked oxidoreductase [Pyronema omphalodes]